MQRDLDRINREIESIARVLSRTPDADPNRRFLLLCLANGHDKRFELRHEPGDIHKVVEYRTIVLTLTSDDDVGLPHLLGDLGIAHGKRFKRLGNKDDVVKAIEHMSLALELIPEGDPDFSCQLANLALFYKDRFQYLGEREDIEKAIECELRAVAVTSNDNPRFPEWLEKLGTSHLYRFERFGEPKDLEIAIDHQSRALALIPNDHPDLSGRLVNLAVSHSRRFGHLGALSDLEEAIQCLTRALSLIPDDHPDYFNYLANLAVSHSDRFGRLGELSDLEKAIQHLTRALALSPNDHPYFPINMANLAVLYKNRFQRLGDLSDLEQAIKHQTRALSLTPDDHPHSSSHLANLATFHSDRFGRLGKLNDLEHAIKYETQALRLTPDDHPGMFIRLANVAASHGDRFGRLGELNDLEHAIKYGTLALALTPDNHPQLFGCLDNLALSHSKRFEHLGELDDLENAIKHGTRALALTPDDHPELSGRLANLAGSHKNRFGRFGELSDLEQAIKHETRALATTPDDHPLFPGRLANLAVSQIHQFQQLGELNNLEQAIKYGTRALAMTPEDHPELSSRLANLAGCHKNRFRHLNELQDLEQAIEYESRALVASTPDHRNSCLFHLNHALSYIDYHNFSHHPSHLQRSLSLFRSACTASFGAPRDRFRIARSWAAHASEHDMLSPIEAYQATIDLLPQFIWLGATADQRYQDLKTVQTLAVDAAHAAIVSSSHSLALEWLEHARCVVWSQNLMLRSPVDHLQVSHPVLATRLQTIARELHTTSSTSREYLALYYATTPEQVGQDHRRLAKEYEDLLAQARIHPGFEDFLVPLTLNRLMPAARNGPIVLINCHPNRCDALVVLPKQPNVIHIPLPNFNGHKAQAARLELQMLVTGLRLPERNAEHQPMAAAAQESDFGIVLAGLWHEVVKPILDHLGYTNNQSTDSLPHITWCPTGAMTFLPLHAAGDYDQPNSRVFNYAISSYAPMLTALLESSPSSLGCDSRVLAVAQAVTSGHAPLPGTTLEVGYLKDHMQGKVNYTQLIDQKATITTVLDEMERHDWVHLACHAHQSVDDPQKSGFFLSDGVLDLDEINRRSFKGKGLAYLSACQTATGDKDLPDKAVHLASGMLMAGYSSVIATMWSVGDKDAPFVADKVYGELMKKGTLGNGEAGRALHDAVGELRAIAGEKEFGRWVQFIHIGS